MALVGYDCWPRNVICEAGALQKIGEIVESKGKKRVIIFTDQDMKEFPLITDTVKKLEEQGFSVSLFGDIGPNPSTAMVHNAVEFMKEAQPEIIVAIGGGSPIDAAKAANVVYTHGGVVTDYDVAVGGFMKITPKLLPFIAVPTTAGTGTEVTNVGVITNEEKQVKFGVLSPLLIPDIALLDPEVTVTMPPKLTAYTGIDALTHCIEAYVSKVDFPPADALAIHGIKMIARSLKVACEDGKNIEARTEMLIASMMGGTAFSLNGLGACHAMAHQLSAFFNAPHGLANAMLLPVVMKYNLPAKPERFAHIAEAMGADIRGLSVEQAAEKALELVEQLAADLGVPKYLDDIGATKDQIPAMVERALGDHPITMNPRPIGAEEVTKLYESVFK